MPTATFLTGPAAHHWGGESAGCAGLQAAEAAAAVAPVGMRCPACPGTRGCEPCPPVTMWGSFPHYTVPMTALGTRVRDGDPCRARALLGGLVLRETVQHPGAGGCEPLTSLAKQDGHGEAQGLPSPKSRANALCCPRLAAEPLPGSPDCMAIPQQPRPEDRHRPELGTAASACV